MTTATLEQFLTRGWCRFAFDAQLADWVAHSTPAARSTIDASEHAQWRRSGNTWFAGVNVLDNDECGRIDDGPVLAGGAVQFIRSELNLHEFAWDKGQVSVCYPGYPKQMADESDAVYNYRVKRDAAHVDGIERVGPTRRRFLNEHHAFVLGIPLTPTCDGASPLVIWEGSHRIVQHSLTEHFSDRPAHTWYDDDITDLYHSTRRRIFDTCARVAIYVQPGEAYVTHRLALHGIQPWDRSADNGLTERVICYFRPPVLSASDWLELP